MCQEKSGLVSVTAARMYPRAQVIRELIVQQSLAGSPTPRYKGGWRDTTEMASIPALVYRQ